MMSREPEHPQRVRILGQRELLMTPILHFGVNGHGSPDLKRCPRCLSDVGLVARANLPTPHTQIPMPKRKSKGQDVTSLEIPV